MKEIKFRAWDKEKKRMLKVVGFSHMNRKFETWYIHCEDKKYNNVNQDGDSIILMQFTGLKDKDDKEIFEGDIVKDVEGYNKVYEIRWDEEHVGFIFIDNNMDTWTYEEDMKLEVIGNIYENPEILEEEK